MGAHDAVPREWPAARCDIVMKGGITSGVVYPRAVHELARHYRLASVGGTSAGAIAAAAAAAAEHGRASGGYDRLAGLPQWIGSDDNLKRLFQPQPRTRALFRMLMAGVGARRWLAVPLAFARSFWLAMLVGALPGAALAVVAARDADTALLRAAGIGGGVLLALGGALLLGLLGALRATRRVAANDFGICSGMPGAGARGRRALTPWLTWLIDDLAGRETGEEDPPLTFGDLWDGPPGDPRQPGETAPRLRLEMMTTNVTNRRAERLPSASREFYFDPGELRRLFPRRVVDHMCSHAPPLSDSPGHRREQQVRRALLAPLRPMPLPEQLPVVVATRMSLSFPVLLSAVPLWRIDWSDPANGDARRSAGAWLRDHGEGLDELIADPVRWRAALASLPRPRAERCWFSDGGVASNFPIHFFDAPMPRHPTFGINLRPFPRGQSPSADEAENVWMVRRSSETVTDAWHRFDGSRGRLWDKHLVAFLSGLVRTMQNRVDDAHLRVPGYRDRVVHVHMSPDEGGMNLAMPAATIDKLTQRGQHAAERLVQAYAQEPSDRLAVSWDAHRWVRMRAALPAIAALLRSFADGWSAADDGRRSYAELIDRERDDAPGSYFMDRPEQRALAHEVSRGLEALACAIAGAPADLAHGAPHPAPEARLVPPDAAADGSG